MCWSWSDEGIELSSQQLECIFYIYYLLLSSYLTQHSTAQNLFRRKLYYIHIYNIILATSLAKISGNRFISMLLFACSFVVCVFNLALLYSTLCTQVFMYYFLCPLFITIIVVAAAAAATCRCYYYYYQLHHDCGAGTEIQLWSVRMCRTKQNNVWNLLFLLTAWNTYGKHTHTHTHVHMVYLINIKHIVIGSLRSHSQFFFPHILFTDSIPLIHAVVERETHTNKQTTKQAHEMRTWNLLFMYVFPL